MDVVAQIDPAAAGSLASLLYDGHGSTRGLVDATGRLASGQIKAYDAFGVATSGQNPILTPLGYAGEWFDNLLQQAYHRHRYLNHATGTWNAFDMYEGRRSSPLTLHKQLYVHGNPMFGIDPTGNFSTTELLVNMGIRTGMKAWLVNSARQGAAGALTNVVIEGAFGTMLPGANGYSASEFVFDATTGFVKGFLFGNASFGAAKSILRNGLKGLGLSQITKLIGGVGISVLGASAYDVISIYVRGMATDDPDKPRGEDWLSYFGAAIVFNSFEQFAPGALAALGDDLAIKKLHTLWKRAGDEIKAVAQNSHLDSGIQHLSTAFPELSASRIVDFRFLLREAVDGLMDESSISLRHIGIPGIIRNSVRMVDNFLSEYIENEE
jgi:RHS repeat-associated protein